MKFALSLSVILASFVIWFQVQYKDLLGSWQLVHFDGMEKIVYSPQYQNATPAQRASMDARIKFRLENTVYEFQEGETLKYIELQDQTIVRKEAKVELSEGNLLLIHDEKGDRLAQIVELSSDKLVLQPISKNANTGKLIFERIKK
ncbi:hypothetical protein [Algoriphagus sp. AK58]|uniref:hypothetical protein n=1 Tax=Algoriphagus sp. AK58 TaxID=1406877 RepID=UPI00164F701E|nr:hypothetical protein [Algoriphagus sp. AK58]MBC6366680.1 hypothetical protein [Algoriphagus sp. AK58]